MLSQAPAVVAFEVSDTGIGIPLGEAEDHLRGVPAGRRQTSRKYGGTGLGLAISRELSNLLGGEIQLRSTPGVGSTFTLYLPLQYVGPSIGARDAPHRRAGAGRAQPARRRAAPSAPLEQIPDDRLDIAAGRHASC